jgi:Na+/H+ antiporter NhaD/arsenite permease-like protein
VASWRATPPRLRAENRFGWSPLREVAILFAGIFVTMHAGAGDSERRRTRRSRLRCRDKHGDPVASLLVTGGLSSFLDNAPTYLTFLTAVLGRFYENQPAARIDRAT